jgi:asparagine synthase (glutamine-hydrolysing)
MEAQFGSWNLDGRGTPSGYLDGVKRLLSLFGPDGHEQYHDRGLDLLSCSFETTEQNPNRQPLLLDSGEVLMWDGRLDNRRELIREIGALLSPNSSDIEIVAAAWSRWHQESLAKLIGDWALSLSNPRDRCLLLAADILASRHLCYAIDEDYVRWCSVPDPLVLLSERPLSLDEEYIAGWLASFPAPHLTPFREIRRVPPASLVLIRPGSCTIRRYWDFDGSRRIRYAKDADYQEHFLELFRQSVRRRLRSTSPVLAELSGGMDSSSIVCIADQLTSGSGSSRVDTVSYYNDGEPHWNERPWFTKVEAQRGRTGLHIDTSAPTQLCGTGDAWFPCRPGACSPKSPVLDYMMRNGHRVLLSGIGGDEFLGGVPTPLPELEDLLARGRFIDLWRQLFAWALVQRRPWIHLLRDAAMGFLPCGFRIRLRHDQLGSWLHPSFAKYHRPALSGYTKRWRWIGALPSFQENADALDGIRRQLGCRELTAGYPYERRYPFLDRDLLEFLFAIPREQLVRPGERRSLMRRALAGIVPEEVLRRKRKAYVSRSPLATAEMHYRILSAKRSHLAIGTLGIVDSGNFLEALNAARQGKDVATLSLLRAAAVEEWLGTLTTKGVVVGSPVPASRAQQFNRDTEPEPIHALR